MVRGCLTLVSRGAWSALGLAVFTTGIAFAQPTGFSLDRLEPTPPGDPFFAVASPGVDGARRLHAGLGTDFAHAPLVLRSAEDGRELGQIVSTRLNLRLQVALTLAELLLLDAEVPFALRNTGDSPSSPRGTFFASPSGVAAGDVRLGARVRLFESGGKRLQLALATAIWLPTGRRADYTGDGRLRAVGMAVAGGALGQRGVWAGNLGFQARGETVLANNVVAKQLFIGAAAGWLVAGGRVLIGPELWGSGAITDRADFFAARSAAAEALLGLHYRTHAVRFGVGAGSGLTVAMGTPDARLVARVSYTPPDQAPPSPLPPPPPPERPPSDRDADGIVDGEDACPLVPGVRDPDSKKNGCPPDRDGDGIVDGEDACPLVPGVRDLDPKRNGCPPDRDGDGIVDGEDACPRERGPRDPDPAKNGCPTLVRVTDREIVILKKIHFEFNKARIMPDSSELLAQVAQVLKEHPEIRRVAIEGHTDAKGSAAFNLRLSQQRAEAVKTWLVENGIEPSRLDALGLGKTRPVAENATEEGREKNRRVEFHILRDGGTP
jgi:OmpA-OmpF porin, OOP family